MNADGILSCPARSAISVSTMYGSIFTTVVKTIAAINTDDKSRKRDYIAAHDRKSEIRRHPSQRPGARSGLLSRQAGIQSGPPSADGRRQALDRAAHRRRGDARRALHAGRARGPRRHVLQWLARSG